MIKRFFDFIASLIGIVFLLPIFIPVIFLVWIQDFSNPFYVAKRVGINKKQFNMIKIRSMTLNADKSGVLSTSNDDKRITSVGRFIRKFKLDELSQLLNVFLGQMSFVGPRPNVIEEVELYSNQELQLLNVKPGITDFSSIVFSDEGSILEGSSNPDLDYNQLIRPGKSILGIFYIKNMNFILDIKLILITFLSIINRKKSLLKLTKIIKSYGGTKELIDLVKRENKLVPMPPPGMDEIIQSR